ncbi:MAG: DUF92 domain-containing protein [Saprospiraceae bacterium]|nr:DUF92 domain-containing protein [Saprospiraceae bacterium]
MIIISCIRSMSEVALSTYYTYLASLCLILITLMVTKYFTDNKLLAFESGRKILHIVAILTCGIVVNSSDSKTELAYLFIFFSVILAYIAHKNLIIPSERKSYGIALFPLAFGILLLAPISIPSVLFAIFTLGLSDALGGLIGLKYGFPKLTFLYEQKSWLGFSIFYMTTCAIAFYFIGFHPVVLIIAALPSLSELFSYRGSDNLTIPLVAAFWYEIMVQKTPNVTEWLWLVIIIFMLWLVYHKKWLNATGSAAALMLAIAIIFPLGPLFLLPMAIFFIIGSLTSKLIPKHKDASGRDAFQVLANGLTAVICFLLFAFSNDIIFLIAYLVSINISLSDTISSDIGTYFGKKTYDIITWKPVKSGLSGGISIIGTVSGVLAAILFGLTSKFIFNLDLTQTIPVILGGITGMFIDSVLGSLIQVKYLTNGQLTEDYDLDSKPVKGLTWVKNDSVNFLSNVLVVLLLIIYLRFYS